MSRRVGSSPPPCPSMNLTNADILHILTLPGVDKGVAEKLRDLLYEQELAKLPPLAMIPHLERLVGRPLRAELLQGFHASSIPTINGGRRTKRSWNVRGLVVADGDSTGDLWFVWTEAGQLLQYDDVHDRLTRPVQ